MCDNLLKPLTTWCAEKCKNIDIKKHIEERDPSTLKAIFLSLFMAEKCFRRDKTAESSGLSEATLSSLIQGWAVQFDQKKKEQDILISHAHK